MAETGTGFADIVGWHLSQISSRLQQAAQVERPALAAADGPGSVETIGKVLRMGDAWKIDGGSWLFPGDGEDPEHWLIVDIGGRRLPISGARIEAIIPNDPDLRRFVADVYSQILGRPADDASLHRVANLLAAGTLSRSAFLEAIASSSEAQQRRRPLILVAYPYDASDRTSAPVTDEDLKRRLSLTVADI